MAANIKPIILVWLFYALVCVGTIVFIIYRGSQKPVLIDIGKVEVHVKEHPVCSKNSSYTNVKYNYFNCKSACRKYCTSLHNNNVYIVNQFKLNNDSLGCFMLISHFGNEHEIIPFDFCYGKDDAGLLRSNFNRWKDPEFIRTIYVGLGFLFIAFLIIFAITIPDAFVRTKHNVDEGTNLLQKAQKFKPKGP